LYRQGNTSQNSSREDNNQAANVLSLFLILNGVIMKKINLPLTAFLLYAARILYFGAEFQDAPVLGILGLLIFGLKYIEAKKLVITENIFRNEVNKDVAKLKQQISGLSMNQNGNPFSGKR